MHPRRPPAFLRSTLLSVLLRTLASGMASLPATSSAQQPSSQPSSQQPSQSTLRLSRLIGDRMVIQRDAAVPVWGWAAPGDQVAVTFDGRTTLAARADARGAWKVVLPARPAGGPYEMTVVDGAQRIQIRDILVGDVWVCSGQSNMEWTVADARNGAQDVAAAHDPKIRHFKVPTSYAEQPEEELAGGDWQVADPAHVGAFTAVGYFFARDLRKSVDVPIGLLHTSWGGSRVEPWMSRQALGMTEAQWAETMRREREYEQAQLDSLRARVAGPGGVIPTQDAGLVEGSALWADPALDDSAWATIDVPKIWEEQGYPGMDGVAWYRTTFTLTDQEARGGVRLALGTIDDDDVSWVNGVEVGRTQGWNRPRVYEVPASALRAGRNVVAVRVQDAQGGGGFYGDPALLYVEAAGGARRPLGGAWRFRVGSVVTSPDGQHVNKIPTLLYNKMVHPLLPYPIKGVLWYQGESNADRYEDAVAYRTTFAKMITSWRREWGVGRQGDFPFLWVQLANYMAPDAQPAERSAWAALRESQSAALALPNTGQAVIIDLGETEDIHPKNKQDVGARLALAARRVAYGERGVVASGPAYRRHRVEGGRVAVEFEQVGGGSLVAIPHEGVARLRAGTGPLKGFAIAGADRKFVWANARIENGRVVVWSDEVKSPVAVRYAWGNNPLDANLYNTAGLPAAPFRTDQW